MAKILSLPRGTDVEGSQTLSTKDHADNKDFQLLKTYVTQRIQQNVPLMNPNEIRLGEADSLGKPPKDWKQYSTKSFGDAVRAIKRNLGVPIKKQKRGLLDNI